MVWRGQFSLAAHDRHSFIEWISCLILKRERGLLCCVGIIFVDTHSLSMTRQVTASAAMTLAVLMSSLDKNITQHNQERQQNEHIWSNNPIITKYYSFKTLHGSCDDGNSHNLHTSYVLFNSIHSINGTDAQWNHHPQRAPHITAWVALLFIISDITFIFLRRWCLFRGVAPVARILRVCIPGIHPSLWIIFFVHRVPQR